MRGLPFVFSVDGIDGTATGATTIGVVDAGTRFYPIDIIVEVSAATTLTVAPTVSVGSNSATFNDIMPATAMTGLTVLHKTLNPTFGATAFTSVPAGGTLGINVTVGATAVVCTLKVLVVGVMA